MGHHRLSPGRQHFCPSSCALQRPHHSRLSGPWAAPCVPDLVHLAIWVVALVLGRRYLCPGLYPCWPEPMDQEVPLEDAGGWQCPPSCSSPWQLTAMSGVVGPQALALYPQWPSLRPLLWRALELLLVPCPLAPPSMMDKGGEEVQRFLWTLEKPEAAARPEDTLWGHFAASLPASLSLPPGPHPCELGRRSVGQSSGQSLDFSSTPSWAVWPGQVIRLLWSCFPTWTMSIMASPSPGSSDIETYNCRSSAWPRAVTTKCFSHLSPAQRNRDEGRRGRAPSGYGCSSAVRVACILLCFTCSVLRQGVNLCASVFSAVKGG